MDRFAPMYIAIFATQRANNIRASRKVSVAIGSAVRQVARLYDAADLAIGLAIPGNRCDRRGNLKAVTRDAGCHAIANGNRPTGGKRTRDMLIFCLKANAARLVCRS